MDGAWQEAFNITVIIAKHSTDALTLNSTYSHSHTHIFIADVTVRQERNNKLAPPLSPITGYSRTLQSCVYTCIIIQISKVHYSFNCSVAPHPKRSMGSNRNLQLDATQLQQCKNQKTQNTVERSITLTLLASMISIHSSFSSGEPARKKYVQSWALISNLLSSNSCN